MMRRPLANSPSRQKVSLSADELERLRKLYKPKPVIDHS
jgi:hypothetical protein